MKYLKIVLFIFFTFQVPRILRTCGFDRTSAPEKYYREQIMLYTHWRDELAIMGNAGSYEARYNQVPKVATQN